MKYILIVSYMHHDRTETFTYESRSDLLQAVENSMKKINRPRGPKSLTIEVDVW